MSQDLSFLRGLDSNRSEYMTSDFEAFVSMMFQ